jgi:hypothetical protein
MSSFCNDFLIFCRISRPLVSEKEILCLFDSYDFQHRNRKDTGVGCHGILFTTRIESTVITTQYKSFVAS